MYVPLSHPKPTRTRFYRAALATVLFAIANFAWANNAGKAIFVLGDVKAFDAQRAERKLVKGDEIRAGDAIVTSHKGQAHIQMSDGGMIAIRPNSEFRIDDYRFEGKSDTDKSVFSLLKGGFRSVTGAIGHANKAAYGVKTPVATIGIRGTDYVARLCDSDCGNNTDGLYVTVLSGGIAVANASGSLDVSPGQYGFTPTTGELPTLLPAAPSAGLFASSGATTSTVMAGTTNTVTAAPQPISSTDTLNPNSASNSSTLALPTQGTYAYTFTNAAMNPTTATISGTSSLTANFSALTISGAINVSNNTGMGVDTWSGTTGTMAINSKDATFGGNFANVNVTLANDTPLGTSGNLTGNLAGPAIAGTQIPSGSANFTMSANTIASGTVSVGGSATLQ